jgi:hypothetical protein
MTLITVSIERRHAARFRALQRDIMMRRNCCVSHHWDMPVSWTKRTTSSWSCTTCRSLLINRHEGCVTFSFCGILYLRLESLTALAVSEARSRTPTMGFVTVPTSPLPKPEMRPYKKTCETLWFVTQSLCWISSIICGTLCMHNVFRLSMAVCPKVGAVASQGAMKLSCWRQWKLWWFN